MIFYLFPYYGIGQLVKFKVVLKFHIKSRSLRNGPGKSSVRCTKNPTNQMISGVFVLYFSDIFLFSYSAIKIKYSHPFSVND